MDVLNCFGQRCCVVYTVGDMLPGVCGVGVNGVWCVVNGLFDRDVP